MVLSSQVSRTNKITSRVTVRSRRKSKRRMLAIVVAIAAVTWLAWPSGDAGQGDDGSNVAADTGGFTAPPSLKGDADSNNAQAANTRTGTSAGSHQASIFGALGNSSNPTRLPNTAGANENQQDVPVFETPGPQTGARTTRDGDAIPPTGTVAPLTGTAAAAKAGNANNATPGKAPVVIKSTRTLADLIPNLQQLLRQVTFTSTGDVKSELRRGMELIEVGKFVEGRKVLSSVLTTGGTQLSKLDGQAIRDTLASVNKSLIFSKRIIEGDTLVGRYKIQSGDLLGKIGRKYAVTYQLLEQINGVKANRIQIGQSLKIINGPFHAVVEKSSYRMDIYLKDTTGTSIYIRSFWVGLGKDDGTPNGTWLCKAGGKLSNPSWRHPRTNEYFAANDPKNPIGDYWIALQGADANTKGRSGYGIHGTIDPDSIGKQKSLGCVRMLPADIKQTFKILVDGKSTVTIRR